MLLSKKLTCKDTLRQVFYLSEALRLPYTLYTCIQYIIHIEKVGGGGEGVNEREG